MTYEKQIWKNGESYLNQDTLNHMEDGIDSAHQAIEEIQSDYASKDYVRGSINEAALSSGGDEVDLSLYALKTDLKDATQMEFNGEPLEGLRRYVYDVNASDGSWSVDYADKNFTKFVNVYFYSIANGTGNSDRTIPTLKQGQPTLTSVRVISCLQHLRDFWLR